MVLNVNDLYEVNSSSGLPKYDYLPAMVIFFTNYVSETLRTLTVCIHVVGPTRITSIEQLRSVD